MESHGNTLALHTLASCLAGPSGAKVLTVPKKSLLLKMYFNYLGHSTVEKMTENVNGNLCFLTHLPLVPLICVSELGQHWFR